MSLPNIPNITPKVSLNRCETINLLLSSIAMEEIGLSHILNAEGEKLQAVIKNQPKCLQSYLAINDSVNKTLRTVVKSQMLLQFKLEDVAALDAEQSCKPHKKHKKPCGHHHHEDTCDDCTKSLRSLKEHSDHGFDLE